MTTDWILALEQRADLTAARGSAAAVAEAVSRGADLRLYMTTDTYEETLYFQQTYSGEADAFAGLMTHHHSYVHHGEDIEQPYLSFFKYDPSGAFSHVKWMPDNTVLDESNDYGYGVYRWFVCDRWRLVYEHDADGAAICGDLEELQEHVRHGRTIKVGIRQFFGLAENCWSGPEHTCFVDTMQPLIESGHVHSNCDLVLVGAPIWPFTWEDGLHVGMIKPSTSGEILSFLVEPGQMPFRRTMVRRGMQWMGAETA